MSTISADSLLLLAHPSPEVPQTLIRSVSGLFDEVAPGCYEALIYPSSYSDKLTKGHWFLSMNRVGCRAELCASIDDGSSVIKTHYGSFTDWNAELTDLFDKNPEQIKITLKLSADGRTLSPYQKAGILGDISLIHVPGIYVKDFFIRPDATDNAYSFLISLVIGGLSVSSESHSGSLAAEISLADADSKELAVQTVSISGTEISLSIPVTEPKLWNPEAPYLYGITVSLTENGQVVERCQKNAGLYTIEKSGQQVLWNGNALKLRGLAYREPLKSELIDPADDLRLFAEAGVNYLRSLYYPFSETLLELCDQAGILVEQSAPIDEVGQSLPANQNAPALRPLFQNQYEEMVLRDRSHPSILLWSLGNNCVWGDQFRQALRLIRSLDPMRLVNFHLPMTIPQDEWVPDVWNVAYSAWNLPADTCFDQMVIFHTQGADNDFGYATGKAQDYSIPVLHDSYALITVYDRDALEEEDGIHDFWGESVSRCWENIRTAKGALGGAVMAAVDEDGSFHPSLKQYCYGILDAGHNPKPEYWHLKKTYQEDPFTICETEDTLTISNALVSCAINKETGLITEITVNGKSVVCGGPFLHTGRYRLGEWKLTAFTKEDLYKAVRFVIEGSYGTDCSVRFLLTVTEGGELNCDCEILSVDRAMPHRVKSGIGLDPGGLNEYGIRFLLPTDTDTLSWTRKSLWNDYCTDHIGRPQGTAIRTSVSDFTSRKVNVTTASVEGPSHQVQLSCSGTQNLRLKLTPDARCVFDDRYEADDKNALAAFTWKGDWYMVDDAAGIENSTECMADQDGTFCKINFTGIGIKIYGSTDRIRGCCDIWIDGRLTAEQISQHTPSAQIPAMSRGYEKRHHRLLFSIDGLPLGDHECVIMVTGTKEPASQGTYISLDSFTIIHPDYPDYVSMIFNQDYNYPRLTQGNYMRPAVMMEKGDILSCNMILRSHEASRKAHIKPASDIPLTIETCSESMKTGAAHYYNTADFN